MKKKRSPRWKLEKVNWDVFQVICGNRCMTLLEENQMDVNVFNNNLSIHPSIFFRLSGAGSRGQQSKQRCPDFPLPRHFLQLFRGDTEAFPGQPGDIVAPACPSSSPGPPPGGTRPEHLPGKASRRHPEQMPELPQLTPLDVEEQRLYSELLPSD